MEITDELIERVARWAHEESETELSCNTGMPAQSWDDVSDMTRSTWIEGARRVLTEDDAKEERDMNDAIRIARRAREMRINNDPEEIARRERERQEEDAHKGLEALRASEDVELLKRSPLHRWFPGCEWSIEGHYCGGTVFGTGPQGQGGHLRLLVTRPGKPPGAQLASEIQVRFAEYEDYDKAHDGDARALAQIDRYGEWKGPVVKSAADVGDCVERQDAVSRSMPAHLP